jgi:hypothetical protein
MQSNKYCRFIRSARRPPAATSCEQRRFPKTVRMVVRTAILAISSKLQKWLILLVGAQGLEPWTR